MNLYVSCMQKMLCECKHINIIVYLCLFIHMEQCIIMNIYTKRNDANILQLVFITATLNLYSKDTCNTTKTIKNNQIKFSLNDSNIYNILLGGI